jgi:hypothetical protein
MTTEYTYSTPIGAEFDTSSDPFSDSLEQINALIKELIAKYSTFRPPDTANGDDPLVADYLSQTLGGARGLMDEYAARASASRARRGASSGQNAPLSESALHHQAMKLLASEYSNKFADAMKSAQSMRDGEYTRGKDALNSLNDLIANRNKLLSAKTDWVDKASNQQLSRDQASLQDQIRNQKAEQENARLNAEREQQQSARDEQLAKESKWRGLTSKARLASRIGKTAAGWTNADDLLSDRLGVEFGYYKPWERKFEIHMGMGRK